MLQLKNITKDYLSGDMKVQALKGIDLEFRKSEFVSILGQSGCGKTTLLNIIGGLDRYTDGDLIINGKSTKQFKDKDWDAYRNYSVGFVFQNYNLIPHQTVLSNVELALTLSGVSKKERKQKAIKALEKVGLKDQIHKKPNQMSGGQMQRVAIARALVNDPDIILADEPTGALDTKTSVQIMDLLKEISKDKLIIMVTHNAELANEYSTRIVELKDGQIINDTNPAKEENKKAKTNVKTKKVGMSMKTALSLSLNNLLTKKGRTILTAFAGSIGIIGIALILSLSHGIQNYIDKTEQETLSSYPLVMEKETVDMSKMIESMAGNAEDEEEYKEDEVHSINIINEIFTAVSQEVRRNNMKDFMKYIESDKTDIKDYVTDIQYGYNITMNLYKNSEDEVVRVNPTTVLSAVGMETSGISNVYSSYMSNYDVFYELLGNQDLLKQQYDLVDGHWPEKYNEVILQVDKENRVSDYTLYSLGILDQNHLKEQFQNMISGKEVEFEDTSYTTEELLNLEFKLVLNTDYYTEEAGIWVNKENNSEYMKDVIKNAETIKIVGIIKPNEEAVSGNGSFGMVGYTHELKEHLINKINETKIVKEQLENPEINVFTGNKFGTGTFDPSKLTLEEQKKLIVDRYNYYKEISSK